jgi:hypothetical protein
VSDDERLDRIESHIISLWSVTGALAQSVVNQGTQFVFNPQTMDIAFDHRLLDTGALGPWQQPKQQAETYS